MIDSHSTLTNINDNLLNDEIVNSKRNINEADEECENEEPAKKQVKLSPFDHGSITQVSYYLNH